MFTSKMQRSFTGVGLLALTLFMAACGSDDPKPKTNSLYVRMGAKAGIEGVADQMVANVGAEIGTGSSSVMKRSHQALVDAMTSVNGAPAPDPMRETRLRNNVVDQFTDITGGPITYQGKSMLVAHTNMQVTEAEYAAWRGLLDDALAKKNIGAKEKAEFTTLIDAMKAEVVNH
ncbi:hypothetical protein [uncultured Hymenobacter sp.]|uniref:globin domain-containing protein n=1 Tax=uncultured Hymenobacter sp. TaxID=170016 RepID=UPI0035CB110A